jgi:transcriptional repressor NrdR
MRCPFCHADDDKVVDSRSRDSGRTIRRRRECLSCNRRFTTYERTEDAVKLSVIKRSGDRVPYEKRKIFEAIRQAAYKRPIPSDQLEAVVDEIEEQLIAEFEKEVSSQTIGERIAAALRRVDKVAYVRFASVYRQFEDVGDFIDEARELQQSVEDIPGQGSLFEEATEQ